MFYVLFYSVAWCSEWVTYVVEFLVEAAGITHSPSLVCSEISATLRVVSTANSTQCTLLRTNLLHRVVIWVRQLLQLSPSLLLLLCTPHMIGAW